ncbi:MAG: RDD family protein, partial [Burkholderiales bacterium]|nr:RDD family protein [Burkholderiales bacterium]
MRDGRFAITTPEGVRLLLTPAGPYSRAFAWVIDVCIFGAIAWVLAIVSSFGGRTGHGIYLVLLFVLYWGYPVVGEVYFAGRTFGKKMLGLRVVRVDGLPVGWRESSLRNLLLVVDFMPLMYATGLLCMLLDLRFRRIGDIVANTQVIYDEVKAKRGAIKKVEPMAAPFPLTPEQQRSLIDLMEREKSIPHARLLELAT